MTFGEFKTVMESAGLALFAWVIYREQVAIRRSQTRTGRLLAAIASHMGIRVEDDGRGREDEQA